MSLLHYPEFLEFNTYVVHFLEAWGCVVLFLPIPFAINRWIPIVNFVAFHIGLALTLALDNFPFITIAMWCCLIPSSFWDSEFARSFTKKIGSFPSPPIEVRYKSVLSVLFIIMMILSALKRTDTIDIPNNIEKLMISFNLQQSWGMFHNPTANAKLVRHEGAEEGTEPLFPPRGG